MRGLKAKLIALLMTISCFAAGLGVMTATVNLVENSGVVAQAEGVTYVVNTLTSVASSTATLIEAYPNDGSGKPTGSWTEKYTLQEGTGAGFCLNGEPINSYSIKQPNDFYIELSAGANAGDVVTIDGTFYNANTGTSFVFKNCSLIYNGSVWKTVSVSAMQDIGSLGLHTNSSVGGAKDVSNQLYLWPTSGTPSVQTWDYLFEPQTANSFEINGEPAVLKEMKSTGDGIFFNFDNHTIEAGDYVSVGGTYYCANNGTVYFITESHFLWNGSGWENYIEYTTYTFNALNGANGCTNELIYAYPTDGDALPAGDWDNRFALESGEGLKLNGVTISGWEIKQPGDFYIVLGKAAVAGDVFTIDGTFINETTAKKFVFNNCALVFNGTTWVTKVDEPVVEYAVHNLGKVVAVADGNASGGYLQFAGGVTLPVSSWDYAFMLFSGNGITVDGAPIDMTNNVKSVGNKLYVTLTPTAASVDSILTISGTFYNDELAIKYVIEESKFTWNGSAWENYIEYTTHNLGKVVAVTDGSAANGYLKFADGVELPISSWDYAFMLFSGNGITVDGAPIDMTNNVKSVGNKLYVTLTPTAASVDSTLCISGTFYNETLAVKYVIEESKFTWNGTTWEPYVDYTTHNLGKVVAVTDGSAANGYLKFADGVELPISSWDYAFMLFSGNGITVDGAPIDMTNNVKSVGNKLYVTFTTPASVDSILTIGGTFYNETLAVKYVIEESKFIFNGSTWSDLQSSYTISNLQPTASNNTTKNIVYLKINGDTNLPITDSSTFTLQDGGLVKEGGSTIRILGAASTSDGFKLNLLASAVTANVKCTLSGTFVCEALGVTYIIEECTMMWTGSAWTVYKEPINYTTYTFNKLNGANGCTNEVIYAYPTDGDTLPTGDWDNRFTLESGEGLKLNGTALSNWEIKQPGDFYIVLGKAAVAGDEFTINGTFINEATAKKFVFNNCALVFDGTAWKTKVDTSGYTTHNLGSLVLHVNSSVGGAAKINNQLYLQRADGGALHVLSWDIPFYYESGTGFMVNGVQKDPIKIRSTGDGFFWEFSALSAGDTITIGGVFACDSEQVKYNIEESSFVWTGSGWAQPGEDYSDLIEGVVYDTVTIVNLGFGIEEHVNGLVEGAGLSYMASAGNTTGSIKFRLGINAENISAGVYDIRFRGTAWDGIRFILGNGMLQSYYLETQKSVPLSSNTYYEIEIGIIDTADGNSIWIYAKVDGVLYISDLVSKTQNKYGDEGKMFSEYNTSHVSFYGDLGAVTLYDPDGVTVTYKTDYGTIEQHARRNVEYTLPQGKTYNVFIGWLAEDGTIYMAGDKITFTESMNLTAITLDFALEDGAAIRLSNSADESGIRFTTHISAEGLAKLESYGITVNSYGTLIMPYDYLARGQAPNLSDFEAGSKVLKIVSTYSETVGDDIVYRGAMQKLNEGNYARLFAGRGFMELTINGEDIIVYTPFDIKDNVRSIRNVANKFQADTEEFNKVSAEKQGVVGAYAANNQINLMNYAAYDNNNFLNLVAWYYPELDSSNEYNNATNIGIADKIKAAGMTAIYLDGAYHLDLGTEENIEKTRQIIKFFWSQGLYTIAFGSNASTSLAIDYSVESFPDFSDCEGFMGYLVWDEPQATSFDKLAQFANNFETVYAGTGATFMTNLLPSYATDFNEGSAGWWASSLKTLNKENYKAYVENYCKTVLSQINGGEKWLSMDSYPINKDQSLTANFLFDLAVLKYYAMEYDAHAHAVLQSSGWKDANSETKYRMPTEAELRMQAYTAMAFGVDSISWWSYSDKRGDNQQNPTDTDNDYYTRFANVNKELSAISAVYSAFDWKGVILGAGKDNGSFLSPDEDYEAYNIVKGQIGDYELSASDTKLLSGVSTNKGNWNYLMGVMEDMNGNEGYVLCNYNSHEEDRAQTITIKFDSNVTKVVIYRGGVATTVAVNNKTLTIDLAMGEGVIVLPSELG